MEMSTVNKDGATIVPSVMRKQEACDSINDFLDNYAKDLQKIQEDRCKDAFKGIISTKLLNNSNLSAAERVILTSLKRNLDTVITDVAKSIVPQYQTATYDAYTEKCQLDDCDKLRVNILINSVRNINISIYKIKFAFEVLLSCNEAIIKKFENLLSQENFSDFREAKKLILGNILIILELYNYLINFLTIFELEGINDIIQFSQDELAKIDSTMKDLQDLRTAAQSPDIDDTVKKQVNSNLDAREESLKWFKAEWEDYLKEIEGVRNKVGNLKNQLPTLRFVYNNAENALAFFEIMKVFGVMKIAEVIRKNLPPLEIEPLPLDKIELISLPPDRVKTVLCLAQKGYQTVSNP